MIPYVIINGVSSRNIDGLIIQSLPPITKPKMRTTIEEIEGKDGDIVTTLGYAAYDKLISIGLSGDYDVNDVIEFFNTSGKITFSNELDKYYKFSQYAQIDLNRLLRFRTADVSIHVQPFKYSIEEPPVTLVNNSGQTIFSMSVKNQGNIYSKPKLEIVGTSTITVYFNNAYPFTLSLGTREKIIIDAETMNATDGSGNYLNRKVTGDYKRMILNPGNNVVNITGNLQSAKLENYSRWV